MASTETDIAATVKKEELRERAPGRWNLSNILSLTRLLLVIPAGMAVWYGSKVIAVALFVLAALTDYLDGYFARRLRQISDFGKVIDPLADKVFVAGIVILLFLRGIIPLWLVVPILARDLLILVGGIYVERRTGIVLPSNWTGKWAVGALSLTILLIYLGVEGVVVQGFVVLTFVMLGLSLFQYVRRTVVTLKESAKEGR